MPSITSAEWSILRIIWTLKRCTTHQIITFLNQKKHWKASTVKTLLYRLRRKHLIKSRMIKHKNIYQASINEQTTINLETVRFFSQICAMHRGKALNYLVQKVPLSQADAQKLIQTLERIKPQEPRHVPCNCLNQDCQQGGNSK